MTTQCCHKDLNNEISCSSFLGWSTAKARSNSSTEPKNTPPLFIEMAFNTALSAGRGSDSGVKGLTVNDTGADSLRFPPVSAAATTVNIPAFSPLNVNPNNEGPFAPSA